MTPKKEQTLVEKAAEGVYTLVDPLDYMLLGFLPEEGQLVFGLYPLGETTKNVQLKFTPQQQKALTNETIGGRLRVMRDQGLTVMAQAGVASGGKHIWQRTKLGSKLLNDWKEKNGGGGSGA